MHVGVKAISTHPVKSSKRDPGLREVVVSFAGVTAGPHCLLIQYRHTLAASYSRA